MGGDYFPTFLKLTQVDCRCQISASVVGPQRSPGEGNRHIGSFLIFTLS